MKSFLLKLVSFIFPVTCSSCGRDMDALARERICAECLALLPLIKGFVCQKCGLELKDGGEFCYNCRKNSKAYAFDSVRSAYNYEGKIRGLILKFKYFNRPFLAKDFGMPMFEAAQKHGIIEKCDYIVPVPLNFLRRIKRGYNQAGLLARELSKHSGKHLLNGVLYRRKITKPQFKLSKEERFKNMKDSFFVKKDNLLAGKSILLVDDIATTAATASACAKVLKSAGAKKVFVLTLARD